MIDVKSSPKARPEQVLLFGLPEADFKTFVGDNADEYLPKWRIMQATESFHDWNWSSGLFTSYWLLYRRMYLWFLAYFIVSMIFWGLLWFLGSTLAFGLFGDWIYLQHVRKKIAVITSLHLNPEHHKIELMRKGGRDWVSPILLIIFQFFCLTAVFILGGFVALKLIGSFDWHVIWHKITDPGLVNT